jgi:hypothetical protein
MNPGGVNGTHKAGINISRILGYLSGFQLLYQIVSNIFADIYFLARKLEAILL